MEEKNVRQKNIKTMIIAVIILVVFLGIDLIEKRVEAEREQEASRATVLVTDNSRYFTVLNCVKKFLNFVQKGSSSDVLLLLNEEYKTSNRIIESNVMSFVPSLDRNLIYDYVGEEMYSKRISENVVEYYVSGKIKTRIMDEKASYTDYDMTIVLYENQFLFSVKPGIGGLDI